jgi:hypothetical protein
MMPKQVPAVMATEGRKDALYDIVPYPKTRFMILM